MLLEVQQQERLLVAQSHQRLVRVGERGIHQVTHVAVGLFVAISPFINLVEGKEPCLFASFLVYKIAFVHICSDEFVAPPRQPFVFGLHVMVVVAAEVQILKGEKLLGYHREC